MDWYGNNVCTFGQKLYFDFAREWDYPYFWDKRLRKDFTVGPRYAYSHVNSLSSAAMAYLATKDESYRNFGDSVCGGTTNGEAARFPAVAGRCSSFAITC